MARPLQRLDINPTFIQSLNAHGYHKVRDVLESSPIQLMEKLNVPLDDCKGLIRLVAKQSSPKSQTVLCLLNESQSKPSYLPVGVKGLDEVLGGGIPNATLTEFVGPGGIGKSHFCLMLTFSALQNSLEPTGTVLFIDTERKFSSQRLIQIAEAHSSQALSHSDKELLLKRVSIITPHTSVDLLNRIKDLESVLVSQNVQLIIIDSIALLTRTDTSSSLQERQDRLGQQASLLKRMAERCKIPVVVTNQVTGHNAGSVTPLIAGENPNLTTEIGSSLGAALGVLFAHAVNTRVVLESEDNKRYFKITKSPAVQSVRIQYKIDATGIELQGNIENPEPIASNVLQNQISHGSNYHA